MEIQTPDVEQLVGDESPRRKIPAWSVLLGMAVALVLAVLILSRVGGPLYGLLFPVDVPVPNGAKVIEHVKPDKGTEYWIYRTTMSGHQVAAFYEKEGSRCWYTARDMSPNAEAVPGGISYSVAQCRGQAERAGLGASWDVYIAEGYSEEQGPTIFRVYKYGEVN